MLMAFITPVQAAAGHGRTVYGPSGILLRLGCFWAWVTQQPRPELAPGGALRWRRGLLAPGDRAGLTRLHKAPPQAQ